MFTTNRPLKNGTTVIYDNKIGQITSLPKTNFATIRLFNTSEIITIEKNKLKATPNDKGELVKYFKDYYFIKNIIFDDNLKYEIDYVNKNNSESKIIDAYHSKLTTIEKQKQEKTISYLKFSDRYNSSVNYLNKKTSSRFIFLDIDDVEKNIEILFERCKLKMCQLNKIEKKLKKSQKLNLQLHFIYKNPFNFITEEYQLIPFEKAELICNEFDLSIDFKIKCKAWSYDLFLNKYKTYFIIKSKYNDCFKKFCENRNENCNNYFDFINSFIVSKKIEGTNYITTNYLLNKEKDMTDLMIDLFNGEEFEFDEDKINSLINKFEIKTRNERNNIEYSLEEEQRKAVIKGITTHCSILTGPPGSGKTEIIKCFTWVLNKLFKENEDRNEEEEDENGSEMVHKYINPENISLMAPTGLAFINLQKNILHKHYNKNISGTCHRSLYHIFENIILHKDPECCNCEEECIYKNEPKLIIIDETSMLDTNMFDDILKMCKKFNSRLIMLGDIQQLPSISAGTVLKNIINSGFFEITQLTKIKRQNAGCLVNNITKMSKNGIITQSDFTDSTMELVSSQEFIMDDKINGELLKQFIIQNNLNKNNTKFITPFKNIKFKFNTNEINVILQDIFNPRNSEMEFDEIPSNSKYDEKQLYRIKDKIVRTENDYSDNFRANGEEAEILDYNGETVTIKYSGPDDKPEEIRCSVLYEEFALNYAITIHKSQGSQYPIVVVLIEPETSFLEKTAVYTAISRSREKCIIISNPNDFISCQKTNNTKKISLFMRISNKYEDELPDYSEPTERRLYLEISFKNKYKAKENDCLYDEEKKDWYTFDNNIYELLKLVPLLQKNKTFANKDFIKENGGDFNKETRMWHTYKSNERLKKFM